MSNETKALVPIEQREVEFYGDEIPAVIVEGGQVYVALRSIADYLGIDWSAQYRRLSRDPVLSEAQATVAVMATDGRIREQVCLPLDYLNGWLFGINANRVKGELRDKVIRYQRDCYRVLAEAFRPETGPGPAESGELSLAYVRGMGLAIARMAEEQMEFDRRLARTEEEQELYEIRLTTIEERIAWPAAVITEEQASQISQAVKAVAMQMSRQSGRNEYGGVYGELYRKFGITSYKLLPANRFQEAMDFLTEWHRSLVGHEPF